MFETKGKLERKKLGAVFEMGKRKMREVNLWSYWSVVENFR